MNKAKNAAIAKDIYNWCNDRELWQGVVIYFNGKAWAYFSTWGYNGKEAGKKIDDNLYEYDNKNCLDYFEYGNLDSVSVSFEGTIYDILNGWNYEWCDLRDKFFGIFEKHGGYAEFGNSWNLTFVEN